MSGTYRSTNLTDNRSAARFANAIATACRNVGLAPIDAYAVVEESLRLLHGEGLIVVRRKR